LLAYDPDQNWQHHEKPHAENDRGNPESDQAIPANGLILGVHIRPARASDYFFVRSTFLCQPCRITITSANGEMPQET
jgi:hypothetical protein